MVGGVLRQDLEFRFGDTRGVANALVRFEFHVVCHAAFSERIHTHRRQFQCMVFTDNPGILLPTWACLPLPYLVWFLKEDCLGRVAFVQACACQVEMMVKVHSIGWVIAVRSTVQRPMQLQLLKSAAFPFLFCHARFFFGRWLARRPAFPFGILSRGTFGRVVGAARIVVFLCVGGIVVVAGVVVVIRVVTAGCFVVCRGSIRHTATGIAIGGRPTADSSGADIAVSIDCKVCQVDFEVFFDELFPSKEKAAVGSVLAKQSVAVFGDSNTSLIAAVVVMGISGQVRKNFPGVCKMSPEEVKDFVEVFFL